MANEKLSAAWTPGATKSITAAISRLRPRSILSRKANSERANKRRADKNEIADFFFPEQTKLPYILPQFYYNNL